MGSNQIHPEPNGAADTSLFVVHPDMKKKRKANRKKVGRVGACARLGLDAGVNKRVNSSSGSVTSSENRAGGAKYIKKCIPSSLKHAVWMAYNGKSFEAECNVDWCHNVINVFSFEAGHNIPESKGGEMTIDNLRPICSQCNKSMGNRYTIDEFSRAFRPRTALRARRSGVAWWTHIKTVFQCSQPAS